MQSYLDLSLLSFIGITIVVLILILISFLISYRHANSLENQIDKLDKALGHMREQLKLQQDQFADFERREMQQKSKLAFFNERCDALERSFQLLSERLHETQEKLKQSELRLEQQQREIVENNAKTQPIFEATRMLRRGATMEEVVRKTGLMRHEIEMLTAVHGLASQANDQPKPEEEQVSISQHASQQPVEHTAEGQAKSELTAEEMPKSIAEQSEPLEQLERPASQSAPLAAEPEPAADSSKPEVFIPVEASSEPSAAVVPDQVESEPAAEPKSTIPEREESSERPEPGFTQLGTKEEGEAFMLEREAEEIREKLTMHQEESLEKEADAVQDLSASASGAPVHTVTPERVISSGHMASLRARSAYGIPERRSSLRRQR